MRLTLWFQHITKTITKVCIIGIRMSGQKNFWVLKVKHVDGASSGLYLVDKDGVVASEAVQQKMCNWLHTLWFMLLKHQHAPISWMKIDILALEFVHLSIRNEFIHFWLCNSDWKTDQLAIQHYLQWTHRPREPGDVSKSMVKQEKSHETSLSAAPAKPKCPQSLTVLPSTWHSKKKKDNSLTIKTVTASVGSTVLINALAKQASMKYKCVPLSQCGDDLLDDSDGAQLSDAPTRTNEAAKIMSATLCYDVNYTKCILFAVRLLIHCRD